MPRALTAYQSHTNRSSKSRNHSLQRSGVFSPRESDYSPCNWPIKNCQKAWALSVETSPQSPPQSITSSQIIGLVSTTFLQPKIVIHTFPPLISNHPAKKA